MCWNKTVSAIALGVGLLVNILGILIINDLFFTCISIVFIFVLFMQLAELLSYISYDRRKGGKVLNHNRDLMRYATQLALMANLGQPLIATLALLPYSSARIEFKMFTVFVTFLYGVYICYCASFTMDKYTVISKNMDESLFEKPCRSRLPNYSTPGTWGEFCMKTWAEHGGNRANVWGKRLEYKLSKMLEYFFGDREEDCHSHIVYPWWRQVNPTPYIICLAVAMVFLIRPIGYMIYQVVAIFGVLIVSIIIFNDGEVGSQWCLGVVLLCILNPIMYYILVKRRKGYVAPGCEPTFG